MSEANDWRAVTLGDVLSPVKRPILLQPDKEYRTLGVRWYGNGAFTKAPLLGSAIAAKTLNGVEAGDVVYSRLFAWKGSFGVIPRELGGVVASTEFPTYIAEPAILLPEFFELWASRTDVWAEAELASTGTTPNSRNRLAPEDFLEFELELPPKRTQARIVACVRAVQAARDAARRVAVAAGDAHHAARVELIEATDHERVALAEVVTSLRGGRSPKCLDRPPAPGEYGVLKVSAIRDGAFYPNEAKALPPEAQPWAAVVQTGDLLYSRANTSTLVGSMCRVPQDDPRLLLCDKTIRVEIDVTTVDADYLVEAVGAPSARDHIEAMAGGTSDSMKNISQENYLDTEVPLPDLARQREVARQLGALRQLGRHAQRRGDALEHVRQSLVEDLVTGVRQPPVTD